MTIAAFSDTPKDNTATAKVLEETIIPLHAEHVSVDRRRVETGRVLATVTTNHHEQVIEEDLVHDTIEVERVPIGRTIDAIPPVREDGDTTIVPVVEEVLVIERRLILKEEVHVRRVRVRERHTATVVTRSQDVTVTRNEPHPPARVPVADHSSTYNNLEGPDL